MGPSIVNIVNFVRAVEPRETVDLLEPMVRQIELLNRHRLPGTFLLQHDAVIQSCFTDVLKNQAHERCEIGGWLEVVQPLVERAGLVWRGRHPWDWHAEVGFTIGYTPAEREKLVDVFMRDFKQAFGEWPRSVGSWFIDAHTLGYLSDRYGIVASCICKDQIGTDGYTIWGGYWNQAFYPSRVNGYMPAQDASAQIPVPVFRMLGSDPIHQYDDGLGTTSQEVATLEPVCPSGGGSHDWVRWFFETNFTAPCLAFAYAQVGQENSFGWPKMAQGLTDQMTQLAALSASGNVRVETLAASGEWFLRTFPVTPATAVTALSDWKTPGRKSVWYESRFYRINLLWEGDRLRVRDIHLFHQDYAEANLVEPVRVSYCHYDALPVVDGFRWSTPNCLAGMRPLSGAGEPLTGRDPRVEESGSDALLVIWPLARGGALEIHCDVSRLAFRITDGAPADLRLELSWNPEKPNPIVDVAATAVGYRHCGFPYRLGVTTGLAKRVTDQAITFTAVDGQVIFEMDATRG